MQWQMHAATFFGWTVTPERRYSSEFIAFCTASATLVVSTFGRHLIIRSLPAQNIFFRL